MLVSSARERRGARLLGFQRVDADAKAVHQRGPRRVAVAGLDHMLNGFTEREAKQARPTSRVHKPIL
jgi:hypothetical protein